MKGQPDPLRDCHSNLIARNIGESGVITYFFEPEAAGANDDAATFLGYNGMNGFPFKERFMHISNNFFAVVTAAFLLAFFLPLALSSAEPDEAAAAPRDGEPVKVVIVVGGHGYDTENFPKAWGGHPDIACTIWEGDPYSLFDDIAGFEYDVILMYNFSSGITDAQKANFLALLGRGVGLVVWHHALANCQNWPEFEMIAGCRFWLEDWVRDSGEEVKRGTTGFAKMKMDIADPGHPITRGMTGFEIEDETYCGQTFVKGIDVLVATDHPQSDRAIAWCHPYASSRVFGFQSGHDARAWTNPGHRRLLSNGIRWVAGRLDSAEGATGAAAERKGNWKQLFNGKDLSGWTPKIAGHEPGDNYGNTFRVEDGVLKVCYDKDRYEKFNGRFGHLFYRQEFSNFRLRVEYRFTGDQVAGGPGWAWRNSGIMIHGQTVESMRKDQDFPVSIEVQLLGGSAKGERPTGNLCTPGTHVKMDGRLLRRHVTNSRSGTYRGDQWVVAEVEVRDGTITHFVDGKPVLTYIDPQLDDKDKDAAALLEGGKPRMLSGGTISLQSESHPVEFRKVEIMELHL